MATTNELVGWMRKPQSIYVYHGEDATLTFRMRPTVSVSGWTLEFRAKSYATNPVSVTTRLFEEISAVVTELTVEDAQDFPQSGEFKIRIDNEIMQVTTGPGYDTNATVNKEWIVERAVHGTTAATHEAKAKISLFTTPQLLLNNGSNGGVSITDAGAGLIAVTFDASFTSERPTGTYTWELRRTNSGSTYPIAHGLLYLLPSLLSALDGVPPHA